MHSYREYKYSPTSALRTYSPRFHHNGLKNVTWISTRMSSGQGQLPLVDMWVAPASKLAPQFSLIPLEYRSEIIEQGFPCIDWKVRPTKEVDLNYKKRRSY